MWDKAEDGDHVNCKKHSKSLVDDGEDDIVEEARKVWELSKKDRILC